MCVFQESEQQTQRRSGQRPKILSNICLFKLFPIWTLHKDNNTLTDMELPSGSRWPPMGAAVGAPVGAPVGVPPWCSRW